MNTGHDPGGRRRSAPAALWRAAGIVLPLVVATPGFGDTISIPVLGFEDDVDVVAAHTRQFMVVCEETENGADARLRLIGLDAGGRPSAVMFVENGILGFENGVDPLTIDLEDLGSHSLVLVPCENEDGSAAELIVLRTTSDGVVVGRRDIDLGNLGFREDVDLNWGAYTGSIAFAPLESEDHSVRGILAVDVDNIDGDWGSCLLLSTDGRAGCGPGQFAPWLQSLADGVDPLVYEVGDALRLALPVTFETGGGDLLLVDFDSDAIAGNVPPVYVRHFSVRAINAGSPHPVTFPGYERDVDLILLAAGECAFGRSMLVPVEDPVAGEGDLYLIGENGIAHWMLSIEGSPNPLAIPGYEAGVDLLPMTGLPVAPANRVAVPLENAAGTEAGLYIVDIDTGNVMADVENPALNPGLTIPGYEIGVDMVRWAGTVVVPVEGPGSSGIVVLQPNGLRLSELFDANFLGFRRSVGPIVAPLTPPALAVPMARDDGTNSDVLVFAAPPLLVGGYSVEERNAGLTMGSFEWDVDLGLIDKTAPGELYLCVPEEQPGGGQARLRFELADGLPGDRVLAVAGEGPPATLLLVDLPTGNVILEKNDVLGLETGLDLVAGSGPLKPGPGWASFFPRFTGFDRDGDPTLMWATAPAAVLEAVAPPPSSLRLAHPNPFAPPAPISLVVPARTRVRLDIVDVAGRRVRRLLDGVAPAGERELTWDGRDDRGLLVPAGVYFVDAASRAAGGRHAVSKLVLIHGGSR